MSIILENVHLFPCQNTRPLTDCQAMKERMFLSETTDQPLFGILKKLIGQVRRFESQQEISDFLHLDGFQRNQFLERFDC